MISLLFYFPFAIFLVGHLIPAGLLNNLVLSLLGLNFFIIMGKAEKSTNVQPALFSKHKPIRWLAFGMLIWILSATINSMLNGDQLLNQFNKSFILTFASVCQLIGASPFLSRKERTRGFYFLMLCLSILCIAQLLLFMAGVRNENIDIELESHIVNKGLILSLFGIDFQRTLLPLAAGTNYNGITMGLLLTSGSVSFLFSRRLSEFLCFVCAPFAIILLTDARAALMSSALAVTITMILRARRLERVGIVMIIAICIAFLFFTIDPSRILYRAGAEGDLLTGRSALIYTNAFSELAKFKWLHFLGYGPYGQYLSGVSQFYAIFLAGNKLVPESFIVFSLHSATLQLIFDWGYIGFAIVVALISLIMVILVSKIQSSPNFHECTAFAVLTYYVFDGLSDSIPFTAYNPIFSTFLAAALMLPSFDYFPRKTISQSTC